MTASLSLYDLRSYIARLIALRSIFRESILSRCTNILTTPLNQHQYTSANAPPEERWRSGTEEKKQAGLLAMQSKKDKMRRRETSLSYLRQAKRTVRL